MLRSAEEIQNQTDWARPAASALASDPILDESRSAAFSSRMLGILNGGALALMASVGHRTGLFDTMADMHPSTAAAIATRAGLNERYVREWLGAMVTGGIVEYEPGSGARPGGAGAADADSGAPKGVVAGSACGLYRLPREHAPWLTRAAGANNLASSTQWIAVLGSVEERIVECFRQGGGVSYEKYARYHEVMAEESAGAVVGALVEHILPLERGLVARLDAGLDVLDVGCGSGRAINALASRFPESRFIGIDFCEEAVAAARAEATRLGLRNAKFRVHDAAELDLVERFDLITAFDAIHDQARPARVLAEISRALRPGGVFLMQDVAGSSCLENNVERPMAPFIYAISCMHSMSVSLAHGGAGLGAAWGEEKAHEMLAAADFRSVSAWALPHDSINVYYVARKRGRTRDIGANSD